MAFPVSKAIFSHYLSDELNDSKHITKECAESIFNFFKQNKLFRWRDANNDCEDRANAICMLLDYWNIPNYKGWIFSGYFYKKQAGSLTNNWNYHVAALLPVSEDGGIKYYVIDPATAETLTTIDLWAHNICYIPYCYYFIKHSHYYIFPSRKIEKDNWYKRNKRNFSWTIQGLSGINGVSSIGKAQLSFKKALVKAADRSFNKLKQTKPEFTLK
jgi:hypothetical protein